MNGRPPGQRTASWRGEQLAVPEVRNPAGRLPGGGDVLHVTRAASVQFIDPLLFRVIRVHDWPTSVGWVWLDGYELNPAWDAVARRSVFVRVAGLVWVAPRGGVAPTAQRNAGSQAPRARAPEQPNRGPV